MKKMKKKMLILLLAVASFAPMAFTSVKEPLRLTWTYYYTSDGEGVCCSGGLTDCL